MRTFVAVGVHRWLLAAGLAVAAGSTAQAACTRVPDEITNPPPDPPELTAPDPKNRDFEFYDQSYALIIGQSDYKKRSKLTDVPWEMKNLKAVLEGQHFLVSLYLNLDSDNLESVIGCFIKSISGRTNARVFIFYAGHGATRFTQKGSVGYVLPTDTPSSTDDPDFLRKALPLSQFVEWAATLEVKHTLFVFDSCFSGSILQSRGDEPPKLPSSNYVFSDPVQLPLRLFITAGSANQEVPAQSTFLKLLLQALLGQRREADVNKDGFLTGTELVSFLEGYVPIYVPNQTPTAGRIKDANLDRGEYIFQLPKQIKTIIVANPSNTSSTESDQAVLTPVFRGTGGSADKAIAQIYEVEKILTTAVQECGSACDPASKAQHYMMKLEIPVGIPSNAEFAEPELKCQGCTNAFNITGGPGLSTDRREAEVSFDSWETSAVWRFTANILVPRTGKEVLFVNAADNHVVSVDPNRLSVVGSAPELKPDIATDVKKAILEMESGDTKKRRQARRDLATYIAGDDGSLVTQLVRGITTGTYRYQLGIVEALAITPNGWKTNESTSKEILLAAKQKTKDATLRASIDSALANLRVSVYYEVGSDGWLTKAGQLKPKDAKRSPLLAYANLSPGTILEADSSVYMRAGPGITFGVVDVLPAAACVRVVQLDKSANDLPSGSGWLQAVRTKC